MMKRNSVLNEKFVSISLALLVSGTTLFFAARNALVGGGQADSQSFTIVWLFLVSAMGFIGCFDRHSALRNKPLIGIWLAAFAIYYFLTWMAWPHPGEVDQMMWAYVPIYGLVPFFLGTYFNRSDLRVFLKAVVVFGIALAIIVTLGFFRRTGDTSRFTVNDLNPLAQADAIGCAILVLVAIALTERRIGLFFIAAIMMLPMLLSGSRGPAISTLLGLIVMIVCCQKRSNGLIALGIIAAGLVMAFWFLPDAVLNRFVASSMWSGNRMDSATYARSGAQATAIQLFMRYPVFGSGTSGNADMISYSHNYFIQILMELGLTGMALNLLFLGCLFTDFLRDAFRRFNLGWEFLAFAGFFTFNIAEAQFSGTYMILTGLWACFGISTAWFRIVQGNEARQRRPQISIVPVARNHPKPIRHQV